MAALLVFGSFRADYAGAEAGDISQSTRQDTGRYLSVDDRQGEAADAPATVPYARHRALDPLLDELATSSDPLRTRILERRIWSLWSQSGHDGIDALMTAAGKFMAERKFRDALQLLDGVVEKAPEFPEGWNRRATVHYLMGNHIKSLVDCRKVLELEPRHFGALSGMGLISIAEGQTDAALVAYRSLRKIYPSMPGVAEQIEALEKELRGEPI